MQDIVIVGGGASGLVAAINIAKKGKNVTILEKNNVCGKKILATGNGRCNYFNEDQNIIHYRSQNSDLIERIINDNNLNEVLMFFKSIGIIPKIKNGYYYPYSNQAVSIQNALLIEARNLNIDIRTDTTVFTIKKENDKFLTITNNGNFYSDKLILATGSKASVKTEDKILGYEYSKQFGHKVVKPLPALVQLKGDEKYFKAWNGIRIDGAISLYENDTFVKKEIGEIQLTDYGVSGICAMNLSGRISRALDEKKNVFITINFLDNLNIFTNEEGIAFIDSRYNLMKNRNIVELLEGLINYKLLNVILNKLKISTNEKWNEISFEDKQKIVQDLINLRIKINSTNSFDKAQICTGGIRIDEIDLNTMESIKTKGLYIIGELLDIDGDCGGYNLSLAWTTGIIVSKYI